MSNEIIRSIILAWGLGGILGVCGCYLVVGAIMGTLLPIPRLMTREYKIGSVRRQILLGIFGVALCLPLLWTLYIKAFKGANTVIDEPNIPEKVETPQNLAPRPTARLRMPRFESEGAIAAYANFSIETLAPREAVAATLLWSGAGSRPSGVLQSSSCKQVEYFGLASRNTRRLKYEPFKNQVYVYVGDIGALGYGNDLYLVISDKPWPASGVTDPREVRRSYDAYKGQKKALTFQKLGDSLDFEYGGRKYRLTISQIYIAVFGSNKIAVEICERGG